MRPRRAALGILALLGGVAFGSVGNAPAALAAPRVGIPVMVQTVPALPGAAFSLDGREFVADRHGLAVTSVRRPGLYRLRVVTPHPRAGFRFARWSEGGSSASRLVRVQTFTLVEAGFDKYRRLDSTFLDLDGRPVDSDRVDSVTFMGSDGARRTVSPAQWLPTTGIRLGASGLKRVRLSYTPQQVVVGGVEISATSHPFVPKRSEDADIVLEGTPLRLEAHNALLGLGTSSALTLEFPDGRTESYEMKDGGLTLPLVPRGDFRVRATGALSTAAQFSAPVESAVHLTVVTYFDAVIVGAPLLLVALWLVWRMRRGMSRGPDAVTPLVPDFATGGTTQPSVVSAVPDDTASNGLRWPARAGSTPPPPPPPMISRARVWAQDPESAISVPFPIWRETEVDSPLGTAPSQTASETESIWHAHELGAASTPSSLGALRSESAAIWDESSKGTKGGRGIPPSPSLPVAIWDESPTRTKGGRGFSPTPSLLRDAPASPTLAPAPDPDTSALKGEAQRDGVPSRFRSATHHRKFLLAAGAVVLLFVADVLFVAVSLSSALPQAANDLEQARAALGRADFAGLRSELEEALDASSRATSLMRHPSFQLLAGVPGLRADGQVLRALGSAGEALAHAGLAAADAGDAVEITTNRSLAASLYHDGRVDLEAVAAAAPHFEEADRRMTAAVDLLNAAPDPALSPLRDALEGARADTVSAGVVTHRASALLGSLPSLMGADGQRRYLLAFQALGEARATGGVMVHYGVVEARDGAITLKEVGPIESGFPTVDGDIEAVLAPRWFERSYGSQLALRQAQQTNTSPNFPAVSEVWLRMYEETHRPRFDGVLAMDPVALQHLLAGTGPIDGGRGPALNSENAARVLLHDSYSFFDKEAAQDLYVTNLIKAFWKKLNEGDVDSPALLSGIAQATATEHLKAYMREPNDQQAMTELGLDGEPAASGANVQLVFHNNYGLNKVDYYLRRKIETDVALDYDGSARVTTTAIMTNTAPSSGPLTDLLGKSPRKQGINRMLLAFLMPRGSTAQEYVEVRGGKPRSSTPFVYKDDGFPVAWKVLRLRPGETARYTIDYSMPDANLSQDGEFQMSLLPQPATVPDNYSVTILPPEGLLIQDAGKVGSEPAKTLTFSGTLDRETVVHTRLLPAEG